MSCNYNCATLPVHQKVECGAFPTGGINAAAFLDCDHTISDFSNASQWTANIAAGNATVITDIKGEIPAASPVMVDNPIGCGAQQIMNGNDNTINWTDSNVNASNDSLYAKINTRKGYLVLFMCEEDQIRVSSSLVTMTAGPATVPNSNQALQMYAIAATFYSKKGVIPMELHDAPAGIFE